MSGIGSSVGPAARPGQRQAENGDEPGGRDDAFADTGGERAFSGFGNASGHHAGARAGDGAHARRGSADSGAQAELARRAGDFRRSLTRLASAGDGRQQVGDAADDDRRPIDDQAGEGRHQTGSGAGESRHPPRNGADAAQGVAGLAALLGRGGRERATAPVPDPAIAPTTAPAPVHGQAADDGGGTQDERLLAASVPAAGSTLPLFTALVPQEVSGAGGRGPAIAAAIEERVVRALQADPAARTSAADGIRIDVAGLVDGLQSITLRLSASGLDVVFAGNLVLGAEAQALADRLSRRFGNRTVRILAVAAGAGHGNGARPDNPDGDP